MDNYPLRCCPLPNRFVTEESVPASAQTAVPFPHELTADFLFELLHLPQNRALRRKLNEALRQRGPALWGGTDQDDDGYRPALLRLLGTVPGISLYARALKEDSALAGKREQLQLLPAMVRHVVRRLRDVSSDDDFALARNRATDLPTLIENSLLPEAALLAWAAALESPDPPGFLRQMILDHPSLATEFDRPLQPGGPTPGGIAQEAADEGPQRRNAIQVCEEIATLLPAFAAASMPGLEAVRRLARLAAELETGLIAAEADRAARHRAQTDELASLLTGFRLPLAGDPEEVPLTERLAATCGAADVERLLGHARTVSTLIEEQSAAKAKLDAAYADERWSDLGIIGPAADAARRAAQAALRVLEDAAAPFLGVQPASPPPMAESAAEATDPGNADEPPPPAEDPGTAQAAQTEQALPTEAGTADAGQWAAPVEADTGTDDGDALPDLPGTAPANFGAPPDPGMSPDKAAFGQPAAGSEAPEGLVERCGTYEDLCRIHWLLRAAEQAGAPDAELPPASAVRAFLIADATMSGEDERAAEIEPAVSQAFAARHPPAPASVALLIPAALVSQQAGYDLLNAAAEHELPPAAAALLKTVADCVRAGNEFRVPLLQSFQGRHAQDAKLAGLRKEAAVWIEAARSKTNKYEPAVRVWLYWLSDDGPLGSLFNGLCGGSLSASAAATAATEWRNAEAVREQVEAADRRFRGHLGDRESIEYAAGNWLQKNAADAARLLGKAAALLGAPEVDDERLVARFETLASAVASARDEARNGDSGASRIAAFALACLGERLVGDVEAPSRPMRHDLSAPLVGCPEIPLDAMLEPREPLPAPQRLREMLAMPPDLAGAARTRAGRGEVAAYEEALFLYENSGAPPDSVQDCRDECAAALDEGRRKAIARRGNLRRRLERDRALDLVPAETAREIEERLSLSPSDDSLDLTDTDAAFNAAETALRDCEASFASDLDSRLARLSANRQSEPGVLDSIRRAIASADLERADEHIRRLEQGLPPLAPTGSINLVLEEFRSFLHKLSPPPSGLLTQRVATDTLIRTHLAPLIDPEAGIEPAAIRPALDAWRSAQSRNGFVREEVRDVLRFLGFREEAPLVHVSGQLFRLHAKPFDATSNCPIHQFGSSAAGRYEILGFDQLPSPPEALLRRIDAAGVTPGAALIVLSARPLAEAARRNLLKALRPRQRPVIVLDGSLLLFLATRPTPRIGDFFRCALPWSGLKPYVTRPGVTLPPEIFVGRIEERREIEAPSGACLMYGGRQLGKTALLREIERAHRSLDDRITFWIDLNGLGIDPDGGRPLAHVWDEIGRQLGARGIREANLGVPQLRTGVEKWLKERPGRGRILVLLDEADTFIEADGKTDFQQLRQMKGLMDATEQRFKVVFTGLHNVQRASHHVNTPVAHLGEPVCIGPLQGRREADEAWRLVTEPFAARGFAFDPPDLPMAILARANYYPSLIQLICEKLLERLDGRERTPPARITEEEVRDVLDDRELRKLLQDRFLRTLGLDPRYHLFALCLAHHALDKPADPRLLDGFDPGWFIGQAQELWPDGFPDGPQPPVVRALLEEMVGLGVLAETRSGGFVLRSPNLRPLLGDRRAVSYELSAFIGRPAPAPYAPGTFLRRMGGDEADPTRSPLSANDEGVVFAREHGVVVVGGLELAGINRVPEALERACPPQGARVIRPPALPGVLDEAALRRMVQDTVRGAPLGTTVILISPDARWAPDLPTVAAGLLSDRKERDRYLRIVFAADAQAAWRWREQRRHSAGQPVPRVHELSLLPWPAGTLRRWAEETGIPGGRDEIGRERLREASGGFGPVLELLAGAGVAEDQDLVGAIVGLLKRNDQLPLGDWPPVAHRALGMVASLTTAGEDFDADGVAAAAEVPRDEALRILDWAEWLGVAHVSEAGRYRLNSLVARLLAAQLA